jgi:hypothetical protein
MRDDFYQTRNSFLIDATEKESMQFRSPYAYVLSHLASQFRGSVTKPITFHYLASPLHHPFWWSVHTSIPQGCTDRNTCRPSSVLDTKLEFVLLGHWANFGSSNSISNSWYSLRTSDGISDILTQVSLRCVHDLQANFWIQPQIRPRKEILTTYYFIIHKILCFLTLQIFNSAELSKIQINKYIRRGPEKYY